MLILLTVFPLLIYIALLIVAIVLWHKLDYTPVYSKVSSTAKVSIIIPVRNESANILNLLDDLNRQDYHTNHYEVIVVDDDSTDQTVALITENKQKFKFNLQVITLKPSNHPHQPRKKLALTTGIAQATGEIILTTDGDCRVPPKWISIMAAFFKHTQARLVSAPVVLYAKNTFEKLQQLEFSTLIGVGAISMHIKKPNMCNGANLAFKKTAFEEVNGYENFEHLASGDDEFLMHKIFKKHPQNVFFLKNQNAIIHTTPQKTLKDFINQRKRWASKWSYYQLLHIKILAFFIFLTQVNFLCLPLLMIFNQSALYFFLMIILGKLTLEFVFLKSIMNFMKEKVSLINFIILYLTYPFYVIYIALASRKGKFDWKDREVLTTNHDNNRIPSA